MSCFVALGYFVIWIFNWIRKKFFPSIKDDATSMSPVVKEPIADAATETCGTGG